MTEPAQPEPDELPGRWLLARAVLTLLLAVLGVLVAALLARHTRAASPPPAASAAAFGAASPERTLVEHSQRGLELRAKQRRALSRYGWVDRKGGVASIPIERAMELEASRAPR